MKQMFVKGLVFGVGVVLILGIGWGAAAFIVDTRAKAVRGDAAANFIESQLKAQKPETK